MHEVLLAGWGCPIGELFDLEKLAAECRRQKRWSFFVSSEPCNVPGGVARYVVLPFLSSAFLPTFLLDGILEVKVKTNGRKKEEDMLIPCLAHQISSRSSSRGKATCTLHRLQLW